MIFSIEELFSNAQSVVATGPSTNTLDFGATGKVLGGTINLIRDLGPGEELPIRVQIVEAYNGNLTTLQVDLQVSADAAFTAPKTVQTSGVIPLAQLGIGRVAAFDYMPVGADQRYMRLNYTVGFTTTAPTTGKITAGIVLDNQEKTL